ncbi:hypothetical protein PGT21_016114 [Puccinia graminis f. sp. tritici]|uniref:Uncharacterized protein n=1 Tax=Puccinia graminis f. sp. tritici TaxID=56615 RepID=A0A5B0RZB4_PUCGR|nr:hypothetical protein PGT21_016114 [Puccinia graminis f. sp. tritici]KAA1130529.1 hypothetical protein PGTUg99_016672 [Puccinia graminis f. sp. tritici]
MVGEDDVGLVFQERCAIQRGCLELLGSRRLSTSIEEPWISTGHVWREEWKESTLGWSDVMKGGPAYNTGPLRPRRSLLSRAKEGLRAAQKPTSRPETPLSPAFLLAKTRESPQKCTIIDPEGKS